MTQKRQIIFVQQIKTENRFGCQLYDVYCLVPVPCMVILLSNMIRETTFCIVALHCDG